MISTLGLVHRALITAVVAGAENLFQLRLIYVRLDDDEMIWAINSAKLSLPTGPILDLSVSICATVSSYRFMVF